jgi:hypothetical protein
MKMHLTKLVALLVALGAILGGTSRLSAQVLVKVDPSQPWVGYMNVFALPVNGGGFLFGNVDATANLRAAFGTNSLTLSPCTNVWETVDTSYVQADGITPAVDMDANFYVEDNTLDNTNVIFIGSCASNTLTTQPEPLTGVTYSSVAFIKIFDGSYNLLGSVTSNLIAGQSFNISMNTAGATHTQYGFETIGPDAAPTNNSLGDVVIAAVTPGQSTTVTVDPSQSWQGYMNVFDLPVSAGGTGVYEFGSAWGVTALQAFLTSSNLTLEPCTNVWNPTDTYWVKADGVTPNKINDASMFVQNDNLVNTNLSFIGTCLSNTLTANPEPHTGIFYTSVAFIKTFDTNFALLNSATSPTLAAGQPFAISLNTAGAVHVEYGFETIGPDASPTSNLGSVVYAAAVPPTPGPTLTNNAPTPSRPQSKVLSLYNSSGVYTNHPVERWLATWSGANESSYTIPATGRTVLKYSNLNYAGVEFYNNDPTLGAGGDNVGGATNFAINTTGYDTMHVDLWTPNANMFGIQLVSINPTEAAQVNFEPPANTISNYTWVSLDIPLSTFAAANAGTIFTNLQQLLWIDNQSVTGGITTGTFYLDNVYFYNSSYVAPAQPAISASVSGGSIRLSFATQNGYNYTVQYKNHITDAVWTTLSAIPGNGSIEIVPDVSSQSSRFYRVSAQ